MVGRPDSEKKIEDVCNRLGTIPAYVRQTDRRTEMLPRNSPPYAYVSRGKKLHTVYLNFKTSEIKMFINYKK